jgi:hypothetical protein
VADDQARKALLRRGFALEYTTLGWNVAGIVVLAIAAISARSVALAGFALDSLIESSRCTTGKSPRSAPRHTWQRGRGFLRPARPTVPPARKPDGRSRPAG